MRDALDESKLPTNPSRNEVNAYRIRAVDRLKRAINLGDNASLAASINASADLAVVRGRFTDTEPTEPAPRFITKVDLNDLMERMNYNCTDCGELGTFIRMEHVRSFIQELKGRLDA